MAQLQHGEERQRQHVGRQPLAQPRHGGDQRAPVLLVVEQHDRSRAARRPVGPEQHAQTRHQIGALRIGIADGAGRAHRAAAATAAAQRRIDRHVIAVWRNRAGGTIVEAVGAADLLAAGVGADAGVVAHVEGLLEFADEVRHLEHGPRHRRRMARVDVQVAVAALRVGKQRRSTRHVEDDVASGARAVARHHELQRALGRRQHRRVAVDLDLEGAEVADGVADAPLVDRHRDDAGGQGVLRIAQQHRDAQAIGKLGGDVQRRLAATVNQADAARFQRRHARRLGHVRGLGQQRRHLRQGGSPCSSTSRRARGCW